MSQQENITEFLESFAKKQKPLLLSIAAVAIILSVGFYLWNYYLPKRETDAQKEMFMAQLTFESENYQLALSGNAQQKGFDYMKKNFKFTKANKLAKLYAGICELNLGKFDDAISDLKSYSSDIPELEAIAFSALGDAYAEKNDMSEAVSYYKKAAESTKNSVLAPKFTFKAAKALEFTKDYEGAAEMYKKVSDLYPNSSEAQLSQVLLTKVENQQ